MTVNARYTVKEAAGKLGVSEATVSRWVKTYATALGLSSTDKGTTFGSSELELLRQIRTLSAQKLSVEVIGRLIHRSVEPVPSFKPEVEDQPMLKGYEPVKPPVEDPRLW